MVFRGLHAVWEENTLIFKPFRFALFFPIFSPLYCDDPSYQHQPQIVISSTPSLHFSSLYWTTVGRICIEKNYTYLSILSKSMYKKNLQYRFLNIVFGRLLVKIAFTHKNLLPNLLLIIHTYM